MWNIFDTIIEFIMDIAVECIANFKEIKAKFKKK